MKPTLLSFLSSTLDTAGRRILKVWNGKSDVRTARQYAPYGVDSNPITNRVVVYNHTQLDGADAALGVANFDCQTDPGEVRLFATDTEGDFKFNIWLRADGTVLIGDSKIPSGFTNFALKYNETKLAYDKTVTYLTTLKAATQAVATAVDAVAPGTSAAFILAMSGQVPGDLSTAKNDKVKFN